MINDDYKTLKLSHTLYYATRERALKHAKPVTMYVVLRKHFFKIYIIS